MSQFNFSKICQNVLNPLAQRQQEVMGRRFGLGDSKKRENGFKALIGAKKFIRRELSRSLKLKMIPELQFVKDESLDYVFKIETILEKISKNNSD